MRYSQNRAGRNGTPLADSCSTGGGVVPRWDGEETAVLRELLLLLYCMVCGFVASGVAASFFRLATSKPARFALLGEGAFGAATTFVFCAVTGPVIIVDTVLKGDLPRGNPLAWMGGGFLVAAVWSTCSGVLLLDLMLVMFNSLGG